MQAYFAENLAVQV